MQSLRWTVNGKGVSVIKYWVTVTLNNLHAIMLKSNGANDGFEYGSAFDRFTQTRENEQKKLTVII